MPLLKTLSNLSRYIPIKKLLGTGVVIGGVTIGASTLMSGYADTRERTTKQDITKERADVQNDMYRNIIQREEQQRAPMLYSLEHLGSVGKEPGQSKDTKSYSGLIILTVIAVAAIYIISGVLKK